MRVVHQAAKAAFEKSTAYRNAINGDSIAQQFLDGILVTVSVGPGAVVAVGNQEDDLAAFAAAILQQLRGAVQRVVERFGGLALYVGDSGRNGRGVTGGGVAVDCRTIVYCWGRRRDGVLGVDLRTFQLGEQLVLIRSEVLTFVKELVETADVRFVGDTHS